MKERKGVDLILDLVHGPGASLAATLGRDQELMMKKAMAVTGRARMALTVVEATDLEKARIRNLVLVPTTAEVNIREVVATTLAVSKMDRNVPVLTVPGPIDPAPVLAPTVLGLVQVHTKVKKLVGKIHFSLPALSVALVVNKGVPIDPDRRLRVKDLEANDLGVTVVTKRGAIGVVMKVAIEVERKVAIEVERKVAIEVERKEVAISAARKVAATIVARKGAHTVGMNKAFTNSCQGEPASPIRQLIEWLSLRNKMPSPPLALLLTSQLSYLVYHISFHVKCSLHVEACIVSRPLKIQNHSF